MHSENKNNQSHAGSKATSMSVTKSRISKRTGNTDLIMTNYTGFMRIICCLPQIATKITHKIPLFFKLLCIVIVPIFFVLILSIGGLTSSILEMISDKNAEDLMVIYDAIRLASMALNVERGEILRYSIVGGDSTNRTKAFLNSDKALNYLDESLVGFTSQSKLLNTKIEECKKVSTKAFNLRQGVLFGSNLEAILMTMRYKFKFWTPPLIQLTMIQALLLFHKWGH